MENAAFKCTVVLMHLSPTMAQYDVFCITI